MLAPLVDAYFADPTKDRLAEIRLNEAKLGATPEDRLRLRWRVMRPATAEPETRAQARTSKRRDDPRLKLVNSA